MNWNSINRKYYIVLHIMILIMSTTGILGKLAASEKVFSTKFLILYGCEILILFIFAIGWQQVIKHIPLTIAFASKSVGIIWTTLWGVLLFDETLNEWKVLGLLMVLIGSIVNATDKESVS